MSARARFAELVSPGRHRIPLDEAAAWMSADEGQGEAGEMLARLDALARRIHLPAGAGLFEKVARLNLQLFQLEGFGGDEDDYHHPRNSCLEAVLERRKGLPILLSVVYLEVGRRVGIELDGISFPGHFLVAPRGADQPFFIDPFHGGRILREEHLKTQLLKMGAGFANDELYQRWTEPASHRQILVRMNNNLKRSWLQRRTLEGALRAVERLLLLLPGQVEERRDRGLLLAELGRGEDARADLETYLRARPDASDRGLVRMQLSQIEAAQGDSTADEEG